MTKVDGKHVRFIFNGACILGAIYMIILYVSRFYQNEDVSSISFQKFAAGPDYDYPKFTICLTDKIFKKGDMFKSKIESVYNVTKSDYMAYLMGDAIVNRSFSHVDYDEVSQKPEDFVIDFHTKDTKDNEINTWTTETFIDHNICWECRNKTYLESVLNKSRFPFLVSYRDPQQICITKETVFDPNIEVRFDQITFDLQKLRGLGRFEDGKENDRGNKTQERPPGKRPQISTQETLNQQNSAPQKGVSNYRRKKRRATTGQLRRYELGSSNITESDIGKTKTNQFKENTELNDSFFNCKIRVYLHDPGQLIQNLNNDYTEYDTKALAYSNSNNLIAIRLQQVTRLHKRSDAIEKCNASIKDEDFQFLYYVITQVGCIPPFWKFVMRNRTGLPFCTKQNQFRSIYDNIIDRNRVSKSYLPGCKQTTILALAESTAIKPENFMIIRFFYQPKSFTEIFNTEAVGFESFWGGVGGFVGIFLGFSLMQIPDLISLKSVRDFISNLLN